MLKKVFRYFIVPYWTSSDWKIAWFLTLSMGFLTYGLVDGFVRVNLWVTDFYNQMQAMNQIGFTAALWHFGYLVMYVLICAILSMSCVAVLAMRWRDWLTQRMVSAWMQDQRYYRLALLPESALDNPDQRISQDIDNFTAESIALVNDLFREVLSIVSFCLILWSIVPHATFVIGTYSLVIPGYLFWTAVGYAALSTFLVIWVGRRLIGLDVAQERREADFRFSLARIREYRESIALMQGEPFESSYLKDLFGYIKENYYQRLRYRIRIYGVNMLTNNLRLVIPFLMASPVYFQGLINFGQLMQAYNAFMRVEDSLSIFAQEFTRLAQWLAVVKRLLTFYEHMEQLPKQKVLQDKESLILKDLQVKTPDGKILFQPIQADILPGQHVLLQGPNGVGKSTLLRCIAGIWPYWQGQITLPLWHSEKVYWAPQKPYLPTATLSACLIYPSVDNTPLLQEQQIKILTAVGLSGYEDQLMTVADWSKVLSLGEQQKLQWARILLKKPTWLFLDEPLSAVDTRSREQLMMLLKMHLGDSTWIMISHFEEQADFWDQIILLEAD